MAPDTLDQISRLRNEVFETITALTHEHRIDVESSRLVDRLQVFAFEIGQVELRAAR